MQNKALKIESLAQSVYKKCDVCGKVKDNFFKLSVYDAKTEKLLVGSLDLCKYCGENMGDILNVYTEPGATLTEFSFEK
ncbi:hypothetical protein DFR54_11814 [Vagococcus fluvialis]|uniref:Uncharacterized protein n=1 Tax=Vagococcus fluvialis TaxID=2738 RepID=A0A369ALY1_9ENTE|nr:hypothetical protein [Vagococcus fluvialis]RCX10392.1 hypothetical protein DFR54_11814 [Vagococcus fluvialis]RST98650.1 hypothetical protein CBF32_12675 [Vagococcus fluvialis]